MQSDYKQIYKELKEENGLDTDIYKDIGSFVFKETYDMIRNPKSLIIKLKGVGSWFLRKSRMEIIVEDFPERGREIPREQFTNEIDYIKYVEKKRQYDLFVERLKDYEKYLKIKKDVREKRNKTQVLLKPLEGEE